MFFGLVEIDDHPCYRMQRVVEEFFKKSIDRCECSTGLFPRWLHATIQDGRCTLYNAFANVHALLYAAGMTTASRRAIYEQVCLTNHIQELCLGAEPIPTNVIDWKSLLGKAVVSLMLRLYESLDLAVFRIEGQAEDPTHNFYSAFIEKNKHICPFCGLMQFKNPRGIRREDLDHYFHKSGFPLAAANMRNLVPTCGTCNQDYKKDKDILTDGSAFYPYGTIPAIRLEIDCVAYPATFDFDDTGKWSIRLELVTPDPTAIPKVNAWNRVYAIKQRIEDEIREFADDWMKQVADDEPRPVDKDTFTTLITSAKKRAEDQGRRRTEPKQILKCAFYDFMLTRANLAFVESFRRILNDHNIS